MQTRTLGTHQVGAIGLGLMTFDQSGTQPRQQLLDTVTAALEAGVTLFDTADAYGPGDELGAGAQGANERLIASLLDELGVRDQVVLATKGGHVRTDGWRVGHRQLGSAPPVRGRRQPRAARGRADRDLAAPPTRPQGLLRRRRRHPEGDRRQRKGRGRGALQRRPRPDPRRARGAGRCPRQRAEPVQPGLPQQPPRDRRVRGARPGVPGLEPARGLGSAKDLATQHPAFADIAEARGVSAQQVALAWELAQSPCVIPIPGAKRPARSRTPPLPPTSSSAPRRSRA